jgi:hypothetical protein
MPLGRCPLRRPKRPSRRSNAPKAIVTKLVTIPIAVPKGDPPRDGAEAPSRKGAVVAECCSARGSAVSGGPVRLSLPCKEAPGLRNVQSPLLASIASLQPHVQDFDCVIETVLLADGEESLTATDSALAG